VLRPGRVGRNNSLAGTTRLAVRIDALGVLKPISAFMDADPRVRARPIRLFTIRRSARSSSAGIRNVMRPAVREGAHSLVFVHSVAGHRMRSYVTGAVM
jgi:hypothetical protein